MLRRLHIQNYAIIDQLEIRFDPHLNIITGETGAGKSILMGALSLILGERADTSVLRSRDRKCVVEGSFSVAKKKEILDFLAGADLDSDDDLLIRREIGTNGKSRAFVNDTPVNLEQLRQLTNWLVDLHRQFDTLSVGETAFQRAVLDALAGHQSLVDQYRVQYLAWQAARQETAQLIARKEQCTREYDYHSFLFNELEEAGFSENELEKADAELKVMGHAEEIKAALLRVVHEVGESDRPLIQQIRNLITTLQSYHALHPLLPALVERLQSIHIELKDIVSEAAHLSDTVHVDPTRMEQLNERLNSGYKLLKKHGLKHTAELLSLQKELAAKLSAVVELDDQIQQKEKQTAILLAQTHALASAISANRDAQAKPLQQKVNSLLSKVGMPNARLQVQVERAPLGEHGQDQIAFLFDANNSGRFEPLHKVASGGELSRLMLCIKSLVARSLDLPTMIFDEIDTGISGEAARQVGQILKALSDQRQIVCITHQPQIAGKATTHFFVYKESKGDMVHTNVRKLNADERITAIAQMLSGEKPTAAALENAREMVNN